MPLMTTLPIELSLLAWSAVLLFVYLMVQGQLGTLDRGLGWNAGARDEAAKPLGVHAGRAERALKNFGETYPAFVVAVLVAVIAGRTGWWSATGAWLWLVARIAYLPLYLFGIPYVRSVAWMISVLGIAMILLQLA